MKINLNKLLFLILSFPKTLYFNLRTFGCKGLQLPVLVSWNTKIRRTYKGAIEIDAPISLFMLVFGFGGSNGVISYRYSELCLEKKSKLILHGKAHFAEGCSIRNSGTISIGANSSMNKNSFISCYYNINIGTNFTAGWNVSIRDSDGHYIIRNGIKQPLFSPVQIGNHVWICSFSDVLKGVIIKDNSVIAYKSLVNKSFKTDHSLIAGIPARIIQDSIDWEY